MRQEIHVLQSRWLSGCVVNSSCLDLLPSRDSRYLGRWASRAPRLSRFESCTFCTLQPANIASNDTPIMRSTCSILDTPAGEQTNLPKRNRNKRHNRTCQRLPRQETRISKRESSHVQRIFMLQMLGSDSSSIIFDSRQDGW